MINKPNELILDKICRSCMCENENMRDVFDSKLLRGESLQLADMLMSCTSITVRSGDGLPNLLCLNCENKLDIAYEFKKQCQNSDSTLRELTNLNSIKEESLDIVVQPDLMFDGSEGEKLPKKTKRANFTCVFCKKVLRTKKGLKIHQRRHTGDKMRDCSVCGSQFTRTHHLIRHMKTHCKTGQFSCGGCNAQFAEVDSLVEHKKSCLNEQEKNDEKNEENNDDDLFNEFFIKTKDTKSKVKKDSYSCKYCGKVMTTFVGLKIHMRRHTGNDLAQCKFCEKNFTKTSHLKRHLQTHGIGYDTENAKLSSSPSSSTEKKVMECEFCDRKFKYKKSFNHHMQTEHGMSDESDVPLSVLIANNENTTIKETQEIEENTENLAENPEKPTNDSTCDQEDKKITDSPPSVEITDTKPTQNHKIHTCHVCTATFGRANHLTRHMTLHRAVLIHKCDRCDKAYATEEYLTKHVEEDHVNKPYVCTICNKPFSRGEHLIRHLKVHQTNDKEKSLTCSVCEKTFSRSDHLARHIKLHLLQDKRHVCPQCGKAFNRLDNLKTHQRVHSGVRDTTKLHLCIYCGKEFNNSSNMIVHMRRHTGERPYKCAQCGKGFPRSHDLKCHERTHSGEKPYQCSLCGKSFNKSNKLLRHTRVHTGERPYVCNICGRAFTQSNDLALHMRRHTGARPYACGVCPARFIQSGQLKTHRRSTGHWMETQPDLKGGHRVEPVTPLVEPTPIRFKVHNKPKLTEDEENVEVKENNAILTMTPLNLNATSTSIVLDEGKIIDLQNARLVNLINANEIKFKNDYLIKCESSGKNDFLIKCENNKECGNSSKLNTFQNTTTVTYSVIAPTSTFTSNESYNFHNYD